MAFRGRANNKKSSDWTAEEDAYCVWSFMMNPIGGICDYLGIPGDRLPSQMYERYFELLDSKELQHRADKFMGEDIIRFHRVKFSKIEEYTISNATRLLKSTNAPKIIQVFQPYLHLTRTPSSIVAQQHKKRHMNYKAELANFIKYKKALLKACTRQDLEEVNVDLKPDEITPYTISNIAKQLKPVNFFQTVGDMMDHVQPLFGKSDFCALRGKGGPFFIRKSSVKIGRKSFMNEDIDIDLSFLNIKKIARHHATILIASDMNFYMTIYGENSLINGRLFMKGKTVRLEHGSVVDIGGFLFLFVENVMLLQQLRDAI